MVDALLDQTEGKFCLSYKINSIFSGSCAQNNSRSVAPAVSYFTANCMSHSSTDLQVIVCLLMFAQGKGAGAQHTCVHVREKSGEMFKWLDESYMFVGLWCTEIQEIHPGLSALSLRFGLGAIVWTRLPNGCLQQLYSTEPTLRVGCCFVCFVFSQNNAPKFCIL